MKTNICLLLSFLAVFPLGSALAMEQNVEQKNYIESKDIPSLQGLCINLIKNASENEKYEKLMTEKIQALQPELKDKFFADIIEHPGKTLLNEICKTGQLPKYLTNLDKETHELLRKLYSRNLS